MFNLAYLVAVATSARVAPFGKIAAKIRNFSQISVAVPLAVMIVFFIRPPPSFIAIYQKLEKVVEKENRK